MSNLEAEHAIRNLANRYADAVNRRDADAWASSWAEDGVWALPGAEPATGRDAIVALWLGAMGRFEFVAQLVHNGTVAVSGDTATARFYLTEHLQLAGGDAGMFNIGMYQDSLVRRDGQWLFAQRNYSVLYNDEGRGDMGGSAFAAPALLAGAPA
ncbi:MAG: nuclear transport factor 2 family protein [Pseudomonadota bacterium]